MKKYFLLWLIIAVFSAGNISAQEIADKPRLYWGYYHNDIDNDYLSKTSLSRWIRGNVPVKIITTVEAIEIPVNKTELVISNMKKEQQKYTVQGGALSDEMKQALSNANSGDMINIIAYFTNNKKEENLRLEFAVE